MSNIQEKIAKKDGIAKKAAGAAERFDIKGQIDGLFQFGAQKQEKETVVVEAEESEKEDVVHPNESMPSEKTPMYALNMTSAARLLRTSGALLA